MVQIRDFEHSSDHSELIEICKGVYNGTDKLYQIIPKVAAEPGMRILSLISERGQLDGLICIQRQSPGTAFLFGLRVRQESRNRGLASRLMQAAERHGRDAGAAALLSCTIMPEMVDTLFPRFGWSCVRRFIMWPSYDAALRMHHQLAELLASSACSATANGAASNGASNGSKAASRTGLSMLPGAEEAASTAESDALMHRWQRCETPDQLRVLLLQLRRPLRQQDATEVGAAAAADVLYDWMPGEFHTYAAQSPAMQHAVAAGNVWLLQPDASSSGSETTDGAALWIKDKADYGQTAMAGVVADSPAALAAAVRQATIVNPGCCKLYADCLFDGAHDLPLFTSTPEQPQDCLLFAKLLL